MYLVLVRHGESIWNFENKFTGWTDVELTKKGKDEAKQAALLLKEHHFSFDIAYTSVLRRAIETLDILKQNLKQDFPVVQNWKLNERHYGALQGLNKDETKKLYGERQVYLWRRSFYEYPPALAKDDERYPGNDPKYQELSEEELPVSENLQDTMKRTISYFLEVIQPELKQQKNILIVAHGNSLRSLIKYLEKISDEDIMKVEIPTGKPYVYELNNELNIENKYYL